jgi:hypothetical protein
VWLAKENSLRRYLRGRRRLGSPRTLLPCSGRSGGARCCRCLCVARCRRSNARCRGRCRRARRSWCCCRGPCRSLLGVRVHHRPSGKGRSRLVLLLLLLRRISTASTTNPAHPDSVVEHIGSTRWVLRRTHPDPVVASVEFSERARLRNACTSTRSSPHPDAVVNHDDPSASCSRRGVRTTRAHPNAVVVAVVARKAHPSAASAHSDPVVVVLAQAWGAHRAPILYRCGSFLRPFRNRSNPRVTTPAIDTCFLLA